ncbi:MAG: hypothetical protein KAS38_11730, partial [Anaerolineales bacterium]|nr:hypothetical protein [Anaerolineales bacterium]
MNETILIRGGGDLASGVALRLYHSGMRIVITELAQPLVIRRAVSFAEAIYQGEMRVEDVPAKRVESVSEIESSWNAGVVPVLVDPECRILESLGRSSKHVSVLVDGRMTKGPPYLGLNAA